MNDNEKKKMCWNCEGEVHFYALQCPYCGVDLGSETEEGEEEVQDLQDAPYRLVDTDTEQENVEIPQAPYSPQYSAEEEETEELEEEQEEPIPFIQPTFKTGIMPLILLLPGVVFVLFGLCLLLFSDGNGFLTLQWRGSFWPFYMISSIPLLLYGWRSMKKIEEN